MYSRPTSKQDFPSLVVMHIYDISKVYDRIPEGAMVIIF